MAIHLEILTPDSTLLKGDVDQVSIPSVNGEVGVMPQHTQYLTILTKGKVSYTQAGQTNTLEITGGVATIDNDKMAILVDGLVSDLNS